MNKPRTRSIREVMLLWQERDRLAKDKGEKEAATASLDSLVPRVEDELLTDRTVDVDEHEGLVDNVDKGNHLNFNLTRSRTLSRTRSTGHVPSCVNFNLSGTLNRVSTVTHRKRKDSPVCLVLDSPDMKKKSTPLAGKNITGSGIKNKVKINVITNHFQPYSSARRTGGGGQTEPEAVSVHDGGEVGAAVLVYQSRVSLVSVSYLQYDRLVDNLTYSQSMAIYRDIGFGAIYRVF